MNKENNKKLKKYKGNRLKAAIGGVPKAPVKTKKSFMSIQKEEGGKENLPTPTQTPTPSFIPAPTPTPTSQVSSFVADDVSDISDGGTNDGGTNDGGTNDGGTNDDNQQQFWWQEKGYESSAAAFADGWRYDEATSSWVQGGEEEDPLTFQQARDARVNKTGQTAEEMAAGIMPTDIPKIPVPEDIDRTDTEIAKENVPQMGVTERGVAGDVSEVSEEQVKEGTATTTPGAAQVKEAVKALTTTVSGTNVAVDAQTGELSADAIARAQMVTTYFLLSTSAMPRAC